MRPVLAVDLICAGRALLSAPVDAWRKLADNLILRAQVADKHRLDNGVSHPEFGDGTLASAARLEGLGPEPDVS